MDFKGYNTKISPTEFEILVKSYLENLSYNLKNSKVEHNIKLKSDDGEYQIDVYAEFEVFGTSIKVLVECKKHKNLIKREYIQILHDKIRSTGSHKGILFSTCGFQKGAHLYANKHGIALITIIDGMLTFHTKSNNDEKKEIDPEFIKLLGIPKFVGEFFCNNGSMISYLEIGCLENLNEFLFENQT